ncbi:MAG: EAL domain-containing protein [Lachnospiraceae bacterium]|nr:EAL domain-containing protein [Lachnospiraceae bacterium]
MNTEFVAYYNNYTPVGDVLTLAICMVFVILIKTTYINRTKNFYYLKAMIILLFTAGLSDLLYNVSMNHIGEIPPVLHYIPRAMVHLTIFANLMLYVLYMKEPMNLEERSNKRYFITALIGYVAVAAFEIIGPIAHIGFYIDKDLNIHKGFPIFPVGYVFYVGMVLFLFIRYHDRLFKQVFNALFFTILVSMLIVFLQQRHGQSSYTVVTFTFPIYALLYLVHSNPYDIESGALGRNAFYDYIKNSHDRKRPLLIMSLLLEDYDSANNGYSLEFISIIRYFVVHFFKGTTLFEMSGGRKILVADINKNPDYREAAEAAVEQFKKMYPLYKIDYKIVAVEANDELRKGRDYLTLLEFIEDKMPENGIHFADEKDIKRYLDSRYILSELADIHDRMDLNDPRVEVYCQPVFNIKKGVYDTAEALMRLKLPKLGMVFPNVFIPIAEKNNYIRTLTKIILNKTCIQIKKMLDEGYAVKRISVNFSVFDVRENDFCHMVETIITNAGISFSNIAIEITESQNESDFEVVKEKINALKGSGIKFYLDDFGTGYSNFERIMELPFDIIKFDRSLVIASSSDDKLKAMVSHIAKMFNDMDYAVLYEGIEDEADEARCMDMSAKYLQGYKYSKPIPIEKLTDYFAKTV